MPFVLNEGQLFLGDHVTFSGDSDIQFSNIESTRPELRIGNRTFIGHACCFHVAHSVIIGDFCNIAKGVEIRDFDGHPMDAMARRTQRTPREGIAPIRIGDDVWIGTNAMILKGVNIGARSVVAAMSLVTNDVPPDTLVAGNPARVVRRLNGVAGATPAREPGGAVPTLSAGLSAADRVRRIVAQRAGIGEADVDLSLWADDYGIDSLGLVILRECLESEFGTALGDSAWMSFRSLREIAEFFEWRTPAEERADPPVRRMRVPANETMRARIDIGIPLTGRNNLAEGPLLQYLGDLRWRQIQELSGVPVSRIVDEAGTRLYPTFLYVDIRFPEHSPMASFGLDDWFDVSCGVNRFGTSVLDGVSHLFPQGKSQEADRGDVPYVRMSNVFVAHHNGAEWLKKSRPSDPGFERVPALTEEPDSIGLTRSAAETGSFSPPPDHYFSLLPGPARIRHKLLPDRDLNAAGLVYFAHYPVFLDIAEREALKEVPLPEELLDLRTVVRRQSAYLSNASARDTLRIEVEPWMRNPFSAGDRDAEDSPLRLWINFRMYRETDGRLMMVSTAEKTMWKKTTRDALFVFDRFRLQAC